MLPVLAGFSFWRGVWALGYHSMGFGHFLGVYWFTGILKSFCSCVGKVPPGGESAVGKSGSGKVLSRSATREITRKYNVYK